MNVFKLRNDLISEYDSYISSFININDDRIRNYVDMELDEGLLWPNPLIQLNPSYEKGASVDELIVEGILEPGCGEIFRINKGDGGYGKPLQLFKHPSLIKNEFGGLNFSWEWLVQLPQRSGLKDKEIKFPK